MTMSTKIHAHIKFSNICSNSFRSKLLSKSKPLCAKTIVNSFEYSINDNALITYFVPTANVPSSRTLFLPPYSITSPASNSVLSCKILMSSVTAKECGLTLNTFSNKLSE